MSTALLTTALISSLSLFETYLEIYRNRIIVWSTRDPGQELGQANHCCRAGGACAAHLSRLAIKRTDPDNREQLRGLLGL